MLIWDFVRDSDSFHLKLTACNWTFFSVLGIEPRASVLLGKLSTTELYTYLLYLDFIIVFLRQGLV